MEQPTSTAAKSATQKIQAYVYDEDLALTLYIDGDISTNGEKPVVILKEKDPQGTVREELLLEFTPDVYDPAGKEKLAIKQFQKKLQRADQYDRIKIIGKKGNIDAQVQHRRR